MNILPKKRWHVRTKANIARVRKDEAEAREAEEKEKRRSQISEREAKINFLRNKNKSSKSETAEVSFESNLAENLLGNIDNARTGRNKEHDEEEKKIKEDYERKIGLLSYLSKKDEEHKPWYMELRDKKTGKEHKDHKKYHSAMDPLNEMKKYLSIKEKSTSKSKKVNARAKKCDKLSKQGKTIEDLRALRLQRERKEREREEQMLLKHHPT